ncbi:MAG: hypothetical protein ACE5KO_03945 [Candidatus Bathyarchaeia archaeon]
MSRSDYKRRYVRRFVVLVYRFGEEPFTTRDVVEKIGGVNWAKASKQLKASHQMLLFKAYKFNLFTRTREKISRIDRLYRRLYSRGRGRKHYVYRLTKKGLTKAIWLTKNRLPTNMARVLLPHFRSIKSPTPIRKGATRWRSKSKLWHSADLTDSLLEQDSTSPERDSQDETAFLQTLMNLMSAKDVREKHQSILGFINDPNIQRNLVLRTYIEAYVTFYDNVVTCAKELIVQSTAFSKSKSEVRDFINSFATLSLRRLQANIIQRIKQS